MAARIRTVVPASAEGAYDCPLYKTTARGGSNFVCDVRLPSEAGEAHWVKRGVASLCIGGGEATAVAVEMV